LAATKSASAAAIFAIFVAKLVASKAVLTDKAASCALSAAAAAAATSSDISTMNASLLASSLARSLTSATSLVNFSNSLKSWLDFSAATSAAFKAANAWSNVVMVC